MQTRSSGILLHITSLPSAFGIGDFGPGAYRFVDLLARAEQHIWQVLPLNPTDPAHANSPYSSSSAFAGNKLLISPDQLISDGYLLSLDIQPVPEFPDGHVDFPSVIEYKTHLLDLAWESYRKRHDHDPFDRFCDKHSAWLEDFALFVVIKRDQDHAMWSNWPQPLRDREADALDTVRRNHRDEIQQVKFEQFLFYSQWHDLKNYANEHRISIFGDIPIYVNFDSADTWSHSDLFKLNDKKRPVVVAGVPPDYFSKTGQLWGNPVYDWQRLKETNYRWWIDRLTQMFDLFDIVRIDHFRGLVAYWEVPASHKTAVKGKWVETPVDDFLDTLNDHFNELPVVAEDLGTITEDVIEVMEQRGFPGMKVLQFAFGEDNPEHPYLPHNYDENSVVYTGTHDNNTIAGWFNKEARPADKKRLFDYLGEKIPPDQVPEALIRLALRSPARWAIIPMQDVLGLPAGARMNTPATRNGNWAWRLKPQQLDGTPAERMADLTRASNRAWKEEK